MSQAKVEQHKKDKANRKKIMAKERVQRLAVRICAVVVLVAIVGWAGYTGYQYYESTRPTKTIYTWITYNPITTGNCYVQIFLILAYKTSVAFHTFTNNFFSAILIKYKQRMHLPI